MIRCAGCGEFFGRARRAVVGHCRACQLGQRGTNLERDAHTWVLKSEATARRRALEDSAPGPSMTYLRRTLLARWIRQGRRCWACSRPADTIDHMVPLSRGGTNHQGNLAPACRTCNSSRGSRLIAEWRRSRATEAPGVAAA